MTGQPPALEAHKNCAQNAWFWPHLAPLIVLSGATWLDWRLKFLKQARFTAGCMNWPCEENSVPFAKDKDAKGYGTPRSKSEAQPRSGVDASAQAFGRLSMPHPAKDFFQNSSHDQTGRLRSARPQKRAKMRCFCRDWRRKLRYAGPKWLNWRLNFKKERALSCRVSGMAARLTLRAFAEGAG